MIEQLDPYTIRKNVIPKTKIFFDTNASVVVSGAWKGQKSKFISNDFLRSQTQSNALICIEKVIDNLNKTEILDEVLPMLISARSSDPVVLTPLLRKRLSHL